MKKTLTKISICLIVSLGNLAIDCLPITKIIIEKNICRIDFDSVLSSKTIHKNTVHFNKEELKEILKINQYQKEHCKK